jgi:hypothetical protein
MFEQILIPRATPVVTPEELAAFARFDIPSSSPMTEDYELIQEYIESATDNVEMMASVACINEQILLTFDSFPIETLVRNSIICLARSIDRGGGSLNAGQRV